MRLRNEQEYRLERLQAAGFVVGERDKRLNTAFQGQFMVAQADYEEQLPLCGGSTEAAEHIACIVGNDLGKLIDDAYCNWLEDVDAA